ncbi:hypothetical protein HPP92_000897 [Vanilla planifolia]|uniref:Uncharacterized protein n=1 Tax=Vanilla planifolia TaxID=51239 RepID=A0A835RQ27_VANPL|nr:hypothetical protein HPP92_000897 [Vanilla planifolia]
MREAKEATGKWLIRFFRGPLSVICRARDCYVRGMTNLAGRMSSGTATVVSISYPCIVGDEVLQSDFFRTSRVSSVDQDIRELVRIAKRNRAASLSIGGGRAVGRCQKVAAWRIDEDGPSDFVGEARIGESLIFPTNRSSRIQSAYVMT